LSILPGTEANLQVDGYRPFDSCKPLGISALGGGALCGAATSPAIWLGDGDAPPGTIDVDKVDIFHLIERDKLKALDSNGDQFLNPGEFLVAGYMPFAYDATQWPRPAWANQPWEGKSAAVFSAGININPRIKPIEKALPTITLFPGAFATPILRLEAGAEWQHEAYKLRTRLLEAINRNLTTGKLDGKTFERDMHAFQAPDVSADDGSLVSVKPSVDLRFVFGLPIGSRVLLGVAADIGLGVDLQPAGYGGVVDLSRGLVEVLDASNPPADAPCTPVLKTVRHPVCSDSQFDFRPPTGNSGAALAANGLGSDPKSTFSCAPTDATRSCCLDVTVPQRAGSTVKRVCIDGWTGITKEICTCTGDATSCINKVEKYLPAEVKADLLKAGQSLAAVKTSWSDKQTCGQRADDNSCRASYPIPEVSSLSDCAKHGRCQLNDASQYDVTEDDCKKIRGAFTPYQCVDQVEVQIAEWRGPGCHPLSTGFVSACGCATNQDCAAGETCDAASHACQAPGRNGCACDPAAAGSCGPGRRCDAGACVKLCGAVGCGNSLVCDGGACVPTGKVPFAEQVVWKANHPVKPMHAISSYSLADFQLAAFLSAGVRVGLTFKLFGRTREFLLLRWSDAWDIGSTRKSRYQPGLEATYQDGCDPATGVVTNYQPGAAAGITCSGTDNLVCRYPSSQSPDWAKFDQPNELLQTCKQAMAGDVEDPPAPAAGDFGQGMSDLVNFGLGIGQDLWSSQQLCVGKGTLLDWLKDAGALFKACKYTGPTAGAQPAFPCTDLQSYLLQIWGCANAATGSGASVAQLLQSRLPGHNPPFAGPPKYSSPQTQPTVVYLDALLADPEAPLSTASLAADVRTALTALQQATVLSWLNGVEQCFSQHQADEGRCRCTTAGQCKEGATCAGGSCLQPNGLQAVCPFVIPADTAPPRARPCCGDGVKLASEQCDDGNTKSGDGCSWDCRNEKIGPVACCSSTGCLNMDPAGPAVTECAQHGGTPFLGKTCSALNQCGHPQTAGTCTLPDGRCQSPATEAQCKARKGTFGASPCTKPPPTAQGPGGSAGTTPGKT